MYHKMKTVKTRKEQECYNCGRIIPVGSEVIKFFAVDTDSGKNGMIHGYACTGCAFLKDKSDTIGKGMWQE